MEPDPSAAATPGGGGGFFHNLFKGHNGTGGGSNPDYGSGSNWESGGGAEPDYMAGSAQPDYNQGQLPQDDWATEGSGRQNDWRDGDMDDLNGRQPTGMDEGYRPMDEDYGSQQEGPVGHQPCELGLKMCSYAVI